MASKLAEKLGKPASIGADGTLTQATSVPGQAPAPDTSLTGTAGQAGLPQTPMMPGTAASLGASPDAAKMAGTPAAQAASVSRTTPTAPSSSIAEAVSGAGTETDPYKAAVRSPKTLQEADKGAAANAERVQTEDEAKRQARSAQLQQAYGDVGLSVANLINQAIPKDVVPGTVYEVKDLPGNLANAQPALAALAANPTDPKALSDAQKAIFEATGQSVSADQITSQYLSDVSGGQAVAGRTPDQIALSPDVLQQLGMTAEDLELIGITGDTSKLTVADISAAIKKANADANPLSDIAAVGQSEGGAIGRAAARDIDRSQGSEQLSTEIATSQLLDKATAGETISIGGQDYKIEDLLNDEKITSLVDEYLASPEGSPLRKQLDTQMPSLAKFANDNAAALATGRKAAEAVAGTVAKNQSGNQKIIDSLSTSLGMDGDAVRAELEGLVPELAERFGTDAGNLDKVGLFAALAKPQPGDIAGAAAFEKAKQLKAADPAAFKAFAQMTPDEVRATGVFSADSEEAAAGWADFIEAVQEQETIKNLPPEGLQSYFFGTGDLQSVWANAKAKMGAGDRSDMDRLAPFMDADKDGKLDDDAAVTERLKATAAQASPTDLVKGLAAGTKVTSGKKNTGGAGSAATGLASKVSSFLANDGKIDAKEIGSIDPATPADELSQLLKTTDWADSGVQSALSAKIQKSKDLAVDKAFDSWGLSGAVKDAVYDSMYNPDKVRDTEVTYSKNAAGVYDGNTKASGGARLPPLNNEQREQTSQAIASIDKMLADPKANQIANVSNLKRARDYLVKIAAAQPPAQKEKAATGLSASAGQAGKYLSEKLKGIPKGVNKAFGG